MLRLYPKQTTPPDPNTQKPYVSRIPEEICVHPFNLCNTAFDKRLRRHTVRDSETQNKKQSTQKTIITSIISRISPTQNVPRIQGVAPPGLENFLEWVFYKDVAPLGLFFNLWVLKCRFSRHPSLILFILFKSAQFAFYKYGTRIMQDAQGFLLLSTFFGRRSAKCEGGIRPTKLRTLTNEALKKRSWWRFYFNLSPFYFHLVPPPAQPDPRNEMEGVAPKPKKQPPTPKTPARFLPAPMKRLLLGGN
jgi:hypothetical protein